LRKCGLGTPPVRSIRENWVGEAVVFLGSANGSYITVASLGADGGKLASQQDYVLANGGADMNKNANILVAL
jgi:hypothetical protein